MGRNRKLLAKVKEPRPPAPVSLCDVPSPPLPEGPRAPAVSDEADSSFGQDAQGFEQLLQLLPSAVAGPLGWTHGSGRRGPGSSRRKHRRPAKVGGAQSRPAPPRPSLRRPLPRLWALSPSTWLARCAHHTAQRAWDFHPVLFKLEKHAVLIVPLKWGKTKTTGEGARPDTSQLQVLHGGSEGLMEVWRL